ncbi:solute carrier family 35 member f6 [Anaeramoeba flamelloides]|uniref:Solute carrier family 35 member f6 n=1 Tax=Anaeramoeba flamelloides TaxID=1746091 RepID=A0ABQ8Z6C8_9EUKA|nr:solute carrier family 35 member f6 [Anaeramoeba flamelloides]
MFVGMLLCLVVFEIYRIVKGKLNEAAVSHKKVYYLTMAPAVFDLLATSIMNIGLLWIPASIWQMLRGSMVVFSAIFSITFLKRILHGYHWLGVFVVVCGLVLVGISCIKSDSGNYDKKHEFIGIFLVVGAQVIQATQIIIEDHLLHNVFVNPLLVVGLEGLWGSIFTIGIFLPIVGNTPRHWGSGFYEDTIDSLIMLGNGDLLGLYIAYVFAILFYNMFGMFVTNTFTAVHRTILEEVRTFCIWITDLIIHYGITRNKGEKWDNWSWMELGGFILLMWGMFIYNNVIQIPGFRYTARNVPSYNDETKPILQDNESSSDSDLEQYLISSSD